MPTSRCRSPRPRHDRLVRLGVVVHLERRVLVVQPVQALLQLLFVARGSSRAPPSAIGLRGTRSAADAPDAGASTACRSCACSRSLATQPMSPACSLGISMRSLPCAMRQVVQLLGAAARGVVQLLAVVDRAGEEAEEGDVADVRLGHRLEDVRRRTARRPWRGSRPSRPLRRP